MTKMRLQPCERCHEPVIPVTYGKQTFNLNRDPVPVAEGGTYAVRDHGGQRLLATKPPPHLAFGRKLYTRHKGCAVRGVA